MLEFTVDAFKPCGMYRIGKRKGNFNTDCGRMFIDFRIKKPAEFLIRLVFEDKKDNVITPRIEEKNKKQQDG